MIFYGKLASEKIESDLQSKLEIEKYSKISEIYCWTYGVEISGTNM
jgi:hypothetical protein